MFFWINIKSFIFYYARMLESLHQKKVSLQSWQVLVLKTEGLYCKELTVLFAFTLPYYSISSFSQLLQQFIFLLKKFIVLNCSLLIFTFWTVTLSWASNRDFWYSLSGKADILMKKRNILKRLSNFGHVGLPLVDLRIGGYRWVETWSSCHATFVIDIFIRLLTYDLIQVFV